jgi:hypothetical protein
MGHDNDDFSEPEITTEVEKEIKIAAARLEEAARHGRLEPRKIFNQRRISLFAECHTEGQYDDDKVQRIIELAHSGDPDAWHLLCWLVQVHKVSKRLPPPNLFQFIVEAVDRGFTKTGRSRPALLRQRDWYISVAVARVPERFPRISNHKNTVGRPKASACWIVMKAMSRIGIGRSEKAVEKIWNNGQKFHKEMKKHGRFTLPLHAVALFSDPTDKGAHK